MDAWRGASITQASLRRKIDHPKIWQFSFEIPYFGINWVVKKSPQACWTIPIFCPFKFCLYPCKPTEARRAGVQLSKLGWMGAALLRRSEDRPKAAPFPPAQRMHCGLI